MDAITHQTKQASVGAEVNNQVSQKKTETYHEARIISTLREGNLYIRRLPSGLDGFKEEVKHLNARDITGVCATHLVSGGATGSFWKEDPFFVIADPTYVYHFKREAKTGEPRKNLISGEDVNHICKILCSKSAHAEKNREIFQRHHSHYQEWTSGSVKENGCYSPRKSKVVAHRYNEPLEYNEIILEGYSTSDLAGIGGMDAKVFSDAHTCNWIKMLELYKNTISKVISCPPLAMVFVQSLPTRVIAIVSLEQDGYSADHVIDQLHSLMDFAGINNLNIDVLGELLSRLPPVLFLKKLMTLELPLSTPAQKEVQKRAYRLATTLNLKGEVYWSSPDYHFPDIEQFLALKRQGANFQKVTCHPLTKPRSLILSSLFESTCNENYGGSLPTFICYIEEKRRNKLTPDHIELKAREIERRVEGMVKTQLLIPELITLEEYDITFNPFAFLSLLKQGAKLQTGITVFFALHRALNGISDENYKHYMKEGYELILYSLGSDFLNKEATRLLFGGAIYTSYMDYLSMSYVIPRIESGLFLIEQGAKCQIPDDKKIELIAACKYYPESFRKIFGMCAEEFIEYIEKNNQRDIPHVDGSYQPGRSNNHTDDITPLIFQLFERQKPCLNAGKSLSDNVQTILDNYYSSPGPVSALKALSSDMKIKKRLRFHHDCDHAVRTSLFTRVFLQFLKTCDTASSKYLTNQPELLDLLTLAELYHDVVAEDEPKEQEEIQAALYLLRDLKGIYPDDLLLEVAVALSNKNTRDSLDLEQERKRIIERLPKDLIAQIDPAIWEQLVSRFFSPDCGEKTTKQFQEWLLAAVRFGDTVDIVRVYGEKMFEWDHLQLPLNMADSDRARVKDLVMACWNLAALTGGAAQDNKYYLQHGLRNPHHNYQGQQTHNTLVRETLSAQENVWQAVRTELDRMARRTVADQAGFRTACAGEQTVSGQERYPLIFDERDLDQIILPADLTELEIFWISLGDFRQLGTCRQEQVKECIRQIKETRFQHSLGTLTQEVLGYPKVLDTLKTRNLECWDDHFSFNGHSLVVKRVKLAGT